jgi:hypothetical protein
MSGSDIPRRAPPPFRQRHGILAWIPPTNERSRGAAHGAMSCSRRRARARVRRRTTPPAAAQHRRDRQPSRRRHGRGEVRRTTARHRSIDPRRSSSTNGRRLPTSGRASRDRSTGVALTQPLAGCPRPLVGRRSASIGFAAPGGAAMPYVGVPGRAGGAPRQSPSTSARQAITHGSTLHDDDSAARADRR